MDKRLAALAVPAAASVFVAPALDGDPTEPLDWGMWLGPLVMVALVLSIAGSVVLAMWIGGDRGGCAQTARDILDERFVRGEIDREEYPRPRRYCR